ncbi:MAG: hypothetical protein WD009_03970 [Phycisphaeraceae bacterium]
MDVMPMVMMMMRTRRGTPPPGPSLKEGGKRAVAAWRGGWLCLALAALAGGCQAGGGAPVMAFPTLGEIASRVTPVLPADAEQPFADARSRSWVTTRQLDLPLAGSVAEAWALVDDTAMSQQPRAAWRGNGVRVGVLDPARLEAFLDRLPRAVATHESRVTDAGYPVELRRSPRLAGAAAVKLPGVEQPERVRGGAMRLLAQVRAHGPGSVSLALVPHHQDHRPTLLPRDPLERELDGRVFEELAARVDLQAGQWLVVGLHHDFPLDADADADDTEGEAEAPASREQAEELAAALPDHLGRALLTARRAGHPVQVMLVIAVEPVVVAGD